MADDPAADLAALLHGVVNRNVDPEKTAQARTILDPYGPQTDAADDEADEHERAIQDFAALMGQGGDDTTPAATAEPKSPLPAPNYAQGSSGIATPRPPDPVEMFEDAVRYAVRSSDHKGNWRELGTPYHIL